MSAVITLDKVSKFFVLQHQHPRSFLEMFTQSIRYSRVSEREIFWVLKDVSFQVGAGEAVGIIGPNGAGKSTILKLITRILGPTSGQVKVKGKVGALLELGAGFHPDLTGRENVYLYGSIMGMSREQIRRRLDAIVDFSGLERFIDVPVRHYSSGMYVRLGFSVAMYTEPDILLADEVLAVGDAVFQRKCLEKIDELCYAGVTILFVSHSMEMVQKICKRVVWLNKGRVIMDGDSMEIADAYSASLVEQSIALEVEEENLQFERWGTQEAVITNVELFDASSVESNIFATGDYLCVRMHYFSPVRVARPAFGIAFYRAKGIHINGPNSVQAGYDIPFIEGDGYVDYIVERLPLNVGDYELTVAIYNHNSTVALDHHHRAYPFTVKAPGFWREEGVVHIPAWWQHTVV
jgi:ABC-type polysaccharide/polyol phosphate transport system ATPase subunit